MFYFGTMEVALVPTNYHLPRVAMFTIDIWPPSIHSNKVGIFGWLIFGLVIQEAGNTYRQLFPRVLMCVSNSWKSLHSMFYLRTVEEPPFKSNGHLPCGMVFMKYTWTDSIHDDEVVTLDWLIFGVEIWVPRRSPIH